MGREVKRVPLDFKWSTKQIWKGYSNPFRSQDCKECDGQGLNKATRKISDDWYSFDNEKWVYPNGDGNRRYNDLAWQNHISDLEVEALVKRGRLNDLFDKRYKFEEEDSTWSYLKEDPDKKRMDWEWVACDEPEYPSAEEVNEWNKSTMMGHDTLNHWICVRVRAQVLGVYGKCEFCKGDGHIWHSEEAERLNEAWEPYDPPKGGGYQLWSTTTEGTPMTPVFETLDQLCEYCETAKVSVFGSHTGTKEKWKSMLSEDLVTYEDGNNVFI